MTEGRECSSLPPFEELRCFSLADGKRTVIGRRGLHGPHPRRQHSRNEVWPGSQIGHGVGSAEFHVGEDAERMLEGSKLGIAGHLDAMAALLSLVLYPGQLPLMWEGRQSSGCPSKDAQTTLRSAT